MTKRKAQAVIQDLGSLENNEVKRRFAELLGSKHQANNMLFNSTFQTIQRINNGLGAIEFSLKSNNFDEVSTEDKRTISRALQELLERIQSIARKINSDNLPRSTSKEGILREFLEDNLSPSDIKMILHDTREELLYEIRESDYYVAKDAAALILQRKVLKEFLQLLMKYKSSLRNEIKQLAVELSVSI